MILRTNKPANQKVHEVGFLLILLLMVVLQFILFYFWIPQLIKFLPQTDKSVVSETQV